MWPVVYSGFTFVRTSEAVAHKVSGSEGYMKGGVTDWQMLAEFHCLSHVTHMQATTLSHSQVT